MTHSKQQKGIGMGLVGTLKKTAQQMVAAALLGVSVLGSAQAATDEFVYFHTDALGSPTAAFSESGAVCWTETYSPYGEKQDKKDKQDSDTPAAGCGLLGIDVGYTGHVQDKNGLVYAQQRYYDPVIGRFMSTDPTMPSAGDPRYFGRYQYGGNNPYKYTDPSGEFIFATIAVVSFAWSAYDAYQTVTDDSLTTTEKAENLAFDAGVALAGGVVGKLAQRAYDATKIADEVVANTDKVIHIGKLDDLKDVPRSQTILDELPETGTPKENWKLNSSILRKKRREGYEIKDEVSAHRNNSDPDPTPSNPDRTVGQSRYGAERNLLENMGINE